MTNKDLLAKLTHEVANTFANYDYSPKNRRENTQDSLALKDLLSAIATHLAHPNMEDVAKNLSDELKEELKETSEKVNDKIAAIKGLEDIHQLILTQENSLLAEEKKMKALFDKAENLTKLKSAIEAFHQTSPEELLQNMQTEQDELLQPVVDSLVNIRQFLTTETDKLSSQVLQLSELLKDELSDTEMAKKSHLVDLQAKNNRIVSHFHAFENAYNTKFAEYTTYYEKIVDIQQQLTELSDVHEKNVKVFDLHFKDNQEIWGSLQQKGFTDIYVAELIQNISKQLLTFDTKLKEIIEGRDKIMVHHYSHQ